MRARTPKRVKQEIEYARMCKEMDAEAKAEGRYVCFFCSEPIRGKADHHHLMGREGASLTRKEDVVLAHHNHHIEYHDISVRKQSWRDIFLENLRVKDLRLYFKEREKENK